MRVTKSSKTCTLSIPEMVLYDYAAIKKLDGHKKTKGFSFCSDGLSGPRLSGHCHCFVIWQLMSVMIQSVKSSSFTPNTFSWQHWILLVFAIRVNYSAGEA